MSRQRPPGPTSGGRGWESSAGIVAVSTPDLGTRPPRVAAAGTVVMVGSVVAVLGVFQQASRLHTLAFREEMERALSDMPVGMSPDALVEGLRLMGQVAAATAAATAVLGWFVRQGSAPARLWLSLLAPVLLVAGLASGGLVVMAVAAAVVLLWTEPARRWFAGLPPVAPTPAASSPAPPAPATRTPPMTAVRPPGPWPTAYAPVRRGPRPPQVSVACWLAWVSCLVVPLGVSVLLVGWWQEPERLLDLLRQADPSYASAGDPVATVRTGVVALGLTTWAWAAAGAAAAYAAHRGSPAGRVLLLVSAGLAVAACLVAVALTWAAVVPLMTGPAVVVLMLRRDVAAWYAAHP